MSDLKPKLLGCPFCGEQCAELVINQGTKWAHYEPSCLEVRTGYNMADDADWRKKAIAAWNTRPAQAEAIKALEAAEVIINPESGQDEWIAAADKLGVTSDDITITQFKILVVGCIKSALAAMKEGR